MYLIDSTLVQDSTLIWVANILERTVDYGSTHLLSTFAVWPCKVISIEIPLLITVSFTNLFGILLSSGRLSYMVKVYLRGHMGHVTCNLKQSDEEQSQLRGPVISAYDLVHFIQPDIFF